MPPSEQNQTPANQPVSNVPEYLHLEPIDPQSLQPKNSKKKAVFIILVSLLVVIGIGVAGLMWYLSAPERTIYSSLDQLLQTRNISHKITVASQVPKTQLTIDTTSQFAENVPPKSSFSYSYSIHDNKVGVSPKSFLLKGQTIVIGPKVFFGKLTESPSFESSAPIKNDKWYEVHSDNNKDVVLFDAFGARSFVQTFVGGLPIGYFGQATRTQIMDFIEANKIYGVSRPAKEMLNGKQTTSYMLKTTSGKLHKLHLKMNELLKINAPAKLSDKAGATENTIKVWVDDSTGRVVRTLLQAKEDGEKSTLTQDVNFDYDANKSVAQPTGAIQRRPN